MRKGIFISLFVLCLSVSHTLQAAVQSYVSTLDISTIQLEISSLISFGIVDKDFIELYNIDETHDGFIDFSIDQLVSTDDVIVSLVKNGAPSQIFGFEFTTVGFQIIAEGQIQTVTNLDPNYTAGTTFKVEKCTNKINYYVDEQLVYAYCVGTENVGALYHRTDVIEINSAKNLNLIFESDFQFCSFVPSPRAVSSDNDISQSRLETAFENLDKKVSPRSYFLINVYDQYANPIRQYRKRSDAFGRLLATEEIKAYLTRGEYQLSIIKQ